MYKNAWSVIIGILLTVSFVGYLLMDYAGEKDVVDNYIWWFFVTATTVGYGDYSPASTLGRFVAVMIMLIGIAVLTLIIAKITEYILNMLEARLKGYATVKLIGHTVLMGYRSGQTEKVIEELLSNDESEKIVLCSSSQENNPIRSHDISFVRGELASAELKKRASVDKARNIIIHGDDDNQSFFTAYAVRECNTSAHMVCYLRNEEHSAKIKSLPAERASLNQVILPVNVYLLAQELQDPESSTVFHQLISNMDGATLYRANIPEHSDKQWEYKDLFLNMKNIYDATVLAIKSDVIISNPSMSMKIKPGYSVFYVSDSRIENIDWERL